ncbi:MAG: hypothetical protein KTV68_02280 [Acidimicrobiia bacterium]|nr:hypothetical protein [Acidimicrobiia bacterium]MCY4432085.1 hypothetical protein [bacterium]
MSRERNPREVPERSFDPSEGIAAGVLNRPPKQDWRSVEDHAGQQPQPAE